jgi:hypothetical protein
MYIARGTASTWGHMEKALRQSRSWVCRTRATVCVASRRSHGRPEGGRPAAAVGDYASRNLRRRLGLLFVVSGRRGVDVGAVRDRAGVVTVRAEHVPQAEDAFSPGVRRIHAATYPDRATTPTVMGWRNG